MSRGERAELNDRLDDLEAALIDVAVLMDRVTNAARAAKEAIAREHQTPEERA